MEHSPTLPDTPDGKDGDGVVVDDGWWMMMMMMTWAVRRRSALLLLPAVVIGHFGHWAASPAVTKQKTTRSTIIGQIRVKIAFKITQL